MKRFFERYQNAYPKLQRCVAVLPWRHHLLFPEKELSDDYVLFYAKTEYQLLLPTKELEIMLLDELRGVTIEKGGDDE